MRIKIVMLTLVCVALLAALPAAANASSRQFALFQDDRQLLYSGDAVRERTLNEVQRLGIDAVKLQLQWSNIAPVGRHKPSGFNGADLADYSPARWLNFDSLIRSATARGLQVLVAVGGPAPGWATAKRGDVTGVYKPSNREYARFVQAAGRRYDGAHTDASGRGLPRVIFWSLWNEPNHPGFLAPQATRGRVPLSPSLYRGLVRAGVAGLRRSGHGRDRVLFGELLPIGKRRIFRKNTMRPVLFLREMFCLDKRYRPYTGRAARARGCKGRFRKVNGVTGFAYHPYTRPNGPRGREPSRDDATIRSIPRITRALDRIVRRGRLPRRRFSVFNTEFGYQSNPPDPFQTPIARIPAFLPEAEWIGFRNRRVASWSQYTLVDDNLSSGGDRYGGWQGGLRFSDGRVKTDVYEAYRSPIFVRLLGTDGIEVFGAARPVGPGAVVQVEQSSGGGFSALGSPINVTNSRGYFRQRFRVAGARSKRYRFRYLDLGTVRFSRAAVPARR